MITGYVKQRVMEYAMELFNVVPKRDVVTWNAIISGYVLSGVHRKALEMYEEMTGSGKRPDEDWLLLDIWRKSISFFEEMKKMKFRPDEITFMGVLIASSHTGKVDEYNVQPNIKHCGCMVDLFGCAGLLDEAFKFIYSMEIEHNTIIWRILLAACRIRGNVELGRIANEQLLKLRQDESGDYV
ncbi:unnamed protein product [Fraxinus pennsylvanica]|uniref:Pentatricopeptide repeat-containing protein n=1 Tax=Fraxinus pennsylvanica TaxID=56036 RepID=A0AAD1YWA3_9LAMI|nr:unnamed protein product [Fraxinus pennsylvanica]